MFVYESLQKHETVTYGFPSLSNIVPSRYGVALAWPTLTQGPRHSSHEKGPLNARRGGVRVRRRIVSPGRPWSFPPVPGRAKSFWKSAPFNINY